MPVENCQSNDLHVVLTREMWSDFFVIKTDDGQTEELDTEETRKWLTDRGADKDKLDKLMDHVWNFSYADVYITNSKSPVYNRLPHSPKI